MRHSCTFFHRFCWLLFQTNTASFTSEMFVPTSTCILAEVPVAAWRTLLKCPLLQEALPNFPRKGSLFCTSLAGHHGFFLHRGLVLPHP